MNKLTPVSAESPERFDAYHRAPFPEALKDPSAKVLVVNLHEPFTSGRSRQNAEQNLRYLFGRVRNVFGPGILTEERVNRCQQFNAAIKTSLVISLGAAAFESTRLIELEPDVYAQTKEPTRFSWGRLHAWDIPPAEAINAFNLKGKYNEGEEIVFLPPHQNALAPYAEAIESTTGKCPNIAQYGIIEYSDVTTWDVSEYRPGLQNYIGNIIGSL